MDVPQDFKCPISMELMKDPVTISTGVTYDRKNIEKWFHIYKKRTCPATMLPIDTLELTPNHTLKRLIVAWFSNLQTPSTSSSSKNDELITLLATIDSTPFKVTSLQKLRCIVVTSNETKQVFKNSGGVKFLVQIMIHILAENNDFAAFRACEEALRILNEIPVSDEDEEILHLLMEPDLMNSMAIMLQRGSSEARFCTISTFHKISKADVQKWNYVAEKQGIDFFKSLLETVSDEICNKTSTLALQVLIEILDFSKKSRLKAIEAGAIRVLIELIPDSNRVRCEKIMLLIKLLCECADGRLGFIEHGLGIAAVSKKLMNVSNGVTKNGVKILGLILNFNPTERVLEEMVVCGAVGKMVAILNVGYGGGGMGSTRERVVRILKMHGGVWRRYPCFAGDELIGDKLHFTPPEERNE